MATYSVLSDDEAVDAANSEPATAAPRGQNFLRGLETKSAEVVHPGRKEGHDRSSIRS